MNKSVLIGICGEMGSGKTTTEMHLMRNHRFTEYSFAKPLKDIAEILGFEKQQLYGSQKDKLEINKFWGVSTRRFLQKFGTEIGCDILPRVLPDMNMGESGTVWIRLFEKKWKSMKYKGVEQKNNGLVVSDVRFENEAASIKRQGGYIIKLVRDTKKDSAENYHSSETTIKRIKYDIEIENNGTLDELFNQIDDIVDKLYSI